MNLRKAITKDGRKILVTGFGKIWVEIGDLDRDPHLLSTILHGPDPKGRVNSHTNGKTLVDCAALGKTLAPIDHQEVWAAGVTYLRSSQARQQESEGAARFYDLVYKAPRPELFFKATPSRVVSPGDPVRFRSDSKWSVPEPELALIINPQMKIVGATIGNDMSARDIEGENPLYLPQAKVYRGACSLGPSIYLVEDPKELADLTITLTITRAGSEVFKGETSTSKMARPLPELVEWLAKENEFPEGVILLTGTGIVPPDEFTLASGDLVRIAIDEIGVLENPVA